MKNKAFTLIEMLVVIALIILLTSILIPATRLARAKAKQVKTRAELQQLVGAWKQYYDDYRTFSEVGEGNDKRMNAAEVNCLRGENVMGNRRRFTYMDFHTDEDEFTDPWGTVYHFALSEDPSAMQADGVSLHKNVAAWSYGPDERSSTNDNIRSWDN